MKNTKILSALSYSVYISIVVTLIILKSIDVVHWSWAWTLSVIWIPLALGVIFFAGVGLKFLTMKKYNK